MALNDGGPAFPQALDIEQEFVGSDGMSLRDYFAGQALVGLCAQHSGREYVQVLWAQAAYLIADAMLEARHAPGAVAKVAAYCESSPRDQKDDALNLDVLTLDRQE